MSGITLDNLRSLDANKSYYIANSTGQIKEAGLWQKFKCFVGVGDGRDKVQKLIDQVKVSLLTASGETDNAALSTDIENYEDNHNWSFAASGRSLAEIANRFAAANADRIASASAREISEERIKTLVKETVRPCLLREDWPEDAVRYLDRAVQPLIDHPPMKAAAGGRRVLDETAFDNQLKDLLDNASTDLIHIAKDARLGMPRFDEAYLDHVFATFYDENGARNDKTEADLRPALDVRLETAREEAGDRPNGIDEAAYRTLARTAIEACGKDVDALNRVLKYTRRILVTDGGQTRSPEKVREYVAGICDNFAELRVAAKGNPAAFRAGLKALGGLRGKPLSRGMVTKIAELANSVELKFVGKLGPGSKGYEIHKALMELDDAFYHMLYGRLRLCDQMDGQDDLPQGRMLAFGFLLGRFSPDVLRNIDAALETPAASRLQQVYFGILSGQGVPDNAGDISDGLYRMIAERSASMNNDIAFLKGAVDNMIGRPASPIDSAKGEHLGYEDVGGDKIYMDLMEKMKQVAKDDRREYLANRAVKGDGPAAAAVRELFSAQLDEFPRAPDTTFRMRFTNCVRPLHSLATLTAAQKVEKGLVKDTGFAKAIADGKLEVELKGGGKLSADPDEALEQLARHVAGRDDATFATLDPSARRTVAVIAGALGDKAMKSLSDGVALAFDPAGDKPALALAGGSEKIRVSVDARDATLLDMTIETERTGASLRVGAQSFVLGPGSAIKTKYTFTIDGPGKRTLDNDVDLDAFDGTQAEEIATAPGSVPDRAKRVKEVLGGTCMLGCGGGAVKADFVLN